MRKKHGAVKNTSHEHERNTVYVMLSDAVLRSKLTDLQYAVTQKKRKSHRFTIPTIMSFVKEFTVM